MAVILSKYTGRECGNYINVPAPAAKQQVRQVAGKSIRPGECGEAHSTAAPTKCTKNVLAIMVELGHNMGWVLSHLGGSQGKVNHQAEIAHETLAPGRAGPPRRKRRFRLGGLHHHYRRSEQKRGTAAAKTTRNPDDRFQYSRFEYSWFEYSRFEYSRFEYPRIPNGRTPTQPPPPQPKPPPENQVIDFDALPTHAVAVVEIREKLRPDQYPAFTQLKLPFTGDWGKAVLAPTLGAKQEIQVIYIPNLDKSSLYERLLELQKNAETKGTKDRPEKAPPAARLALADWCLKHGRVQPDGKLTDFVTTMDQFAQDEPKHPAAIAYLQVKKELAAATTLAKPNGTRDGLLKEYKAVNLANSPHYTAYHKHSNEEPPEVRTRLRELEKAHQTFYYWYALRGLALPVPKERLPVIVAFQEDEFKHLNGLLSENPVNGDSFVGRRDGILVLSSKRRDAQYAALERHTNPFWSEGINRKEVLVNALTAFPQKYQGNPYVKGTLEALALVQLVMETDAERAAITRDGSSQLLHASGLLPRSVVAPEWVQFGMGSFFETPVMSPYVSAGGASSEYLPLWKEMKKAKLFGKTSENPKFDPAETLRLVVTDSYFRQAQKEGTYSSLRRARATSWGLAYFLAHGNNKLDGSKATLDGLQKYFKELAKMPRDMELDEDALLYSFCKSFGLLDDNGKADTKSAKFQIFATTWVTFLEQEEPELKTIVTGIRTVTEKKVDGTPDGDKKLEYTDAPLMDPFHPEPPGPTMGPMGSGTRPNQQYPPPMPGSSQTYPPMPKPRKP